MSENAFDQLHEALGASETMDDVSTSSSEPLGAGRVGERYEIIGLLGSGGMGYVYKVRDRTLDEVVALKTLHAEYASDERSLARFRREVKLARRVTHPNVARTFDIGTIDGVTYLTMEYVDGKSMRALFEGRERPSIAQTLEVFAQVCEGLQAAHDAGVVHRDLKPENVVLERGERAVITDFGVAKAPRRRDNLLQTGVDGLIGTPQYMSPEQVEGADELDGRSDVYAIGVMLYEALSGTMPWSGESPISVAVARLVNPPPSLLVEGIPGELADLVARAMARDPAERPATAGALASALREIGRHISGELRAPERLAYSETLPTPHGEPTNDYDDITLAVLPVRDRTGEDAHVADGLAEELIGELAMVERLRVKPISATRGLDPTEDAQALGRQLGVSLVVDTSIRLVQDKLRARVALISVEDGFQIWGGKFKGCVGDVFEIAEDAAEAIAGALVAQVNERSKPTSAPDPIAADLYMRGRRVMLENWGSGVEAAIEYFERALERAPEDARVLTGLATAHSRAGFFERDAASLERRQRNAREYALRALEIAPKWADPHYALALIAYNSSDFGAAARHCVEALSLYSDHVDARDLLGRVLTETGPLDLAIHHMRRALAINPRQQRTRWDLARAYALTHDWETADVILETLATDFPEQAPISNGMRARFQMWRGDAIDVELIDTMRRDPEFTMLVQMADMYEQSAESLQSSIQGILEELRSTKVDSRLYMLRLQMITDVAIWVGAVETALDALEDLVELGLADLMWLERSPVMIRMAERPRFVRAVATVRERTASARDQAITQLR